MVRVKLLVPVIIRSAALSKVTALVTVRSVLARVRARLVRFKVVTVMVPAPVRVALPARVKVVGAVKVVPVKVASPLKTRVLPVISKTPPDIIVLAAKVTVPPVLVI